MTEFDSLFDSMPVLGDRKSPEISALLGFVLGGIGLGIYHRSVIDFLLPMLLVLMLSPLHVFGLFGGWCSPASTATSGRRTRTVAATRGKRSQSGRSNG